MEYSNKMITAGMQETEQRFLIFVDKLKDKTHEFVQASLPELREMNENKEEADAYHRMKAAVLGQIESLRKKAYTVLEEKISTYTFPWDDLDLRNRFYAMRTVCHDAYISLDELIQYYRNEIEATFSEDLEAQYQYIVDEFEKIKNQFNCTQCGGDLSIDRIYFTTTYIPCPYCQTQNTFEPSSQAKSLEHLGRSLAEQRSLPLLKHYQEAAQLEANLFQQKHRLEVDLSFERSEQPHQKRNEFETAALQWEKAKEDTIKHYESYLRGMFDEWNKINPAMTTEHERFYQRMLDDYTETRLRN